MVMQVPQNHNLKLFFVNEGIDRLFKVIDTPGINDKNDLQNLKKLGDEIFNCSVHCVVLCLDWNTRINDVNTISTIEFYRELLLPVVKAGNVVLVLTKFRQKDYKEIEDVFKKKLEQLQNLVNCTLGYKIGTVEVTNAGDSKQKEGIYSLTKDARIRILKMASKFKPQSLGCRIPLPPYLRNSQTIIKNSMKREIKLQERHIADLNEKLPQTLAEYKKKN